jgi:hypothetical protein
MTQLLDITGPRAYSAGAIKSADAIKTENDESLQFSATDRDHPTEN